jgi:hypothetical protein
MIAAGCQVVQFPSEIGNFIGPGDGTTTAVQGVHDGYVSADENAQALKGMTLAQVMYVTGSEAFVHTYSYSSTYVVDDMYTFEPDTCDYVTDGTVDQYSLPNYHWVGSNQDVSYDFDHGKLDSVSWSDNTCES